jgi:hypothetical protein
MWKSIYDSFLQLMTVSWAEFIKKNKSTGSAVRDNFRINIYPEIGLYLIAISLALTLFYYYYLNLRFGKYYKQRAWFVILTVNSLIVGTITYLRADKLLDNPVIDVSKHLLWISLINAIYAAILFFIISLIIKWSSPMGKRTPF